MGKLLTIERGRKLLEVLEARQQAKWNEVKDLDLKSKQRAFPYERSRRLLILENCRTENTRARILNNQHLLDRGWLIRAERFRNSMLRSLNWLISRGYIIEY